MKRIIFILICMLSLVSVRAETKSLVDRLEDLNISSFASVGIQNMCKTIDTTITTTYSARLGHCPKYQTGYYIERDGEIHLWCVVWDQEASSGVAFNLPLTKDIPSDFDIMEYSIPIFVIERHFSSPLSSVPDECKKNEGWNTIWDPSFN